MKGTFSISKSTQKVYARILFVLFCILVCLGPCPHSDLLTSLDCDTNAVSVSWTPGSGILYYNASADPFNARNEPQSCSTNGSSCNVTSLRCGESYRVSVSGQGETCPSPSQSWNRLNTGTLCTYRLFITSGGLAWFVLGLDAGTFWGFPCSKVAEPMSSSCCVSVWVRK